MQYELLDDGVKMYGLKYWSIDKYILQKDKIFWIIGEMMDKDIFEGKILFSKMFSPLTIVRIETKNNISKVILCNDVNYAKSRLEKEDKELAKKTAKCNNRHPFFFPWFLY